MNMEQEIIKVATGAATTAANKGIGKLTDLVFSKRLRQQKRLDHLSSIQDQKDAELIQNGLAEFRDGKFLLMEDQIGNPTSPLGLILAQNNQDQADNLGKCLSKAYEHLSEKTDEAISDDQISGTFFNKWINYGKEVSEEELQDLWGRILSEEISSPNSINFLVLNTFSLMSKQHLEAFHQLVPFICDGNLYCNDHLSAEENYQHIPPVTLAELIDLNIIKGLLSGDIFFKNELHPVTKGDESFPSISINKTNFMVLHLTLNTKEPKPKFYLLTTVGQKLFEIAMSNYKIEDYFFELTNTLKLNPDFNTVQTFELVSLIDNIYQSKLKISR